MPTTIQISNNVKEVLDGMKLFERDTYNEIIERMIEDDFELNEKTKEEILDAKKRIASGRFLRHEEVGKKLGL